MPYVHVQNKVACLINNFNLTFPEPAVLVCIFRLLQRLLEPHIVYI